MIVVDPTCQIVSNHSKSHGELFNKMYIDHPRLWLELVVIAPTPSIRKIADIFKDHLKDRQMISLVSYTNKYIYKILLLQLHKGFQDTGTAPDYVLMLRAHQISSPHIIHNFELNTPKILFMGEVGGSTMKQHPKVNYGLVQIPSQVVPKLECIPFDENALDSLLCDYGFMDNQKLPDTQTDWHGHEHNSEIYIYIYDCWQ